MPRLRAACCARSRPTGHGRRSGLGRAAGQDRSRDAPGRWPVSARCRSALLRHRRRDAAVRFACRPLFRAHRRLRDLGALAHDWAALPGSTASGRGRRLHQPSRHGRGLANQGWKDSYDSIFHADGRLAEGRSRSSRCRPMWWRPSSWRHAASSDEAMTARAGWRRDADGWRTLRALLLVPELGSTARHRRPRQPCRIRTRMPATCCSPTSPPGAGDRGGDGLLRPQIFLGVGHPHHRQRRSALQSDVVSQRLDLAARQRDDRARARPLRLQGLGREPVAAQRDAATTWRCDGCPSCSAVSSVCRGRGPTLYPVACAPQAWASATPFTLIEACLGLEFDPIANEIRLRNPRLPDFLDHVVLRNLQLKQSSVDSKVQRHQTKVSVEILERRGHVQISGVVFGSAPIVARIIIVHRRADDLYPARMTASRRGS